MTIATDLYRTGSGPLTTTGATTTLSNLFTLTSAGGSLIEANAATLIIANPTASGQTITAATLSFSDTINGVVSTISYALSSVSIAAGNNQAFPIALTQGILKNASLSVTFGANPAAATLNVLLLLRAQGGNLIGPVPVSQVGAPWTMQGAGAAGAAVTGNPFLVAGKDGSGNAQPLATDTSGRQAIMGGVAAGQSGSSINPVLTGKLDGSSNVQADQANQDVTLLTSATRTGTTQSADQTNNNGRGVVLVIDITAASGTGGLTLALQGKDPASSKYYTMKTVSAALTATGTSVYPVYPGISAGGTTANSGVLPRTWRVQVTHGDSSNYTYSVGASVIL